MEIFEGNATVDKSMLQEKVYLFLKKREMKCLQPQLIKNGFIKVEVTSVDEKPPFHKL